MPDFLTCGRCITFWVSLAGITAFILSAVFLLVMIFKMCGIQLRLKYRVKIHQFVIVVSSLLALGLIDFSFFLVWDRLGGELLLVILAGLLALVNSAAFFYLMKFVTDWLPELERINESKS